MKRVTLLCLLTFGLILITWTIKIGKASSIATDGITGKWTGILRSQGATFPLSYVFNVQENKLTGTGLAPGGVFDLTSCVIKGNDFSFELLVGDENVRHDCRYYPVGDSVGVNIFFDGNNLHSILLRSK